MQCQIEIERAQHVEELQSENRSCAARELERSSVEANPVREHEACAGTESRIKHSAKVPAESVLQ